MLDKFIYGLGAVYTVVIGVLAAIAMIYYISNYAFGRMKANIIFFDFVRNRKEFKEWQRAKNDLKFKDKTIKVLGEQFQKCKKSELSYKEFTHHIIKNNITLLIECDISKESKAIILNNNGYTSDIL